MRHPRPPDLFLGALLEHLRGPVLGNRSGTPKVFVVLFSSGNSPWNRGTSWNHRQIAGREFRPKVGTKNGTFLLQVVLIRIGHCGNAVLRYTLLEIMPVDHEIRTLTVPL